MESVDKLPSLQNKPDYYAWLCVTGGRLNLYKALLYKPHYFTLAKDDNVPDGNRVLPGQLVTYTINYYANNHSDVNVNIVDTLADELDYNWSDSNGIYNDVNRTVTWNIGSVSADSNGSIKFLS